MKKLVLLIIVSTISLLAQQPVVLQPWMQVEGTYNGQRLGSQVSIPQNNINFNFRALISDRKQTGCYTLNSISDTSIKKIIFGNNVLTGDLNDDGYTDIIINKTTDDYDTVYIYWGVITGIDTLNPLIIPGEYQYDGLRALRVGDINNDGKQDLILTATRYPNLSLMGKLYIFLNPVNKIIPDYNIIGDTVNAGFGVNVLISDLNNDGLNDLIVKGWHQTGQLPNRYDYINIYYADTINLVDTVLDLQIRGDISATRGLACFDVNGDNKNDLLWTNYSWTDSLLRIKIHFADEGHIDSIPSLIIVNDWAYNITNAGDMNGDGFNDILISSNYSDNGGDSFIFVYSGGPNIDTNFDAAVGVGGVSNLGAFGSIAGIGDVNGDGFDDILVGAYAYQWFTERGKWFVFLGDSSIPVTSVRDEENNTPKDFTLFQNYPNPFNPTTSIQYAISSRQIITIKVYDVLGKEVAILVNEEKPAGTYEVTFNAGELSSGVYFYTLTLTSSEGKKQTITKKMILLSELEKRQEEEYEKQLWGMVKSGDKAAQIELTEIMRDKRSSQLSKFLIDETQLQSEEIVERIEQ